MAYRKNEGYLIKFDDRIVEDGTVIAGWSDWIADFNSNDVSLLDQSVRSVCCQFVRSVMFISIVTQICDSLHL